MATPTGRLAQPQYQRLELPTNTARVQARNRTLWNAARERDADFYTLSYTGRSVDEIAQILSDAGVVTVVDIRHTPVSMYRPEIAKSNLARLLGGHGIEYVHLPDLGVPRDIRIRAVEHGTRDVIWSWYDEHVVGSFAGDNLDRFFNVAEHPIAFMCVEIDPAACHRHRLALALEARGLRGYDL